MRYKLGFVKEKIGSED